MQHAASHTAHPIRNPYDFTAMPRGSMRVPVMNRTNDPPLQALLLSFARPGSVVVIVLVTKAFDGFLKLTLSMAEFHVLEFLVHRPTELAVDVVSFEHLRKIKPGTEMQDFAHLRKWESPLMCAHSQECQLFWARHQVWPIFNGLLTAFMACCARHVTRRFC
jgi:hypothetical protein